MYKVIKRYTGNRKLYDADEGRYITLSEIYDQVRSGTNVTVMEAGIDVTAEVLMKALIEKDSNQSLDTAVVTRVIKSGDGKLHTFLSKYVTEQE